MTSMLALRRMKVRFPSFDSFTLTFTNIQSLFANVLLGEVPPEKLMTGETVSTVTVWFVRLNALLPAKSVHWTFHTTIPSACTWLTTLIVALVTEYCVVFAMNVPEELWNNVQL